MPARSRSCRAARTVLPQGHQPASRPPAARSRSSRRVTQADVDGALAALEPVAPAGVPGGDGRSGARRRTARRVFPSTGQLGEPTPERRPRHPGRPGGRDVRRSGCPRPARSSPSTTAPVSVASPRPQIQAAVAPGHELVAGLDRGRRRRCDRHRPDGQLPGPRPPPSRSPSSTRSELKAMVLGKPIDEATRHPRAVRPGRARASRPTGPARSRASTAGSTLTDRPGRPDRDAGPVRSRVDLARRDAAGDQPSGELDPVTRLLGIDLGERRIGLALADDDGSAARPLSTLRRGRDLDADATALAAVVEAQGIDALVVGLPLEASGDEGPQAVLTRAWGDAIRERLGLPVSFRDERLSSHLAEARLGPDEARTFRRPAEQDPARRLPGAGRSRGRRHHPPGRARHTSRSPFVHATTPGPPGDQPMTIRSGGRPRDRRAHARPARTIPTPTRPKRSPSSRSRSRARAAAGTVAAAGTLAVIPPCCPPTTTDDDRTRRGRPRSRAGPLAVRREP